MAVNATELVPELLEAGVHFGHQTKRWNPKMKPYIFEQKNQIYIINLDETVTAAASGDRVSPRGDTARRQNSFRWLQEAGAGSGQRSSLACGQFYVNQRWLGGTLTNLATIRKSIGRLKYIEEIETSPEYKKMGKQELAALIAKRRNSPEPRGHS